MSSSISQNCHICGSISSPYSSDNQEVMRFGKHFEHIMHLSCFKDVAILPEVSSIHCEECNYSLTRRVIQVGANRISSRFARQLLEGIWTKDLFRTAILSNKRQTTNSLPRFNAYWFTKACPKSVILAKLSELIRLHKFEDAILLCHKLIALHALDPQELESYIFTIFIEAQSTYFLDICLDLFRNKKVFFLNSIFFQILAKASQSPNESLYLQELFDDIVHKEKLHYLLKVKIREESELASPEDTENFIENLQRFLIKTLQQATPCISNRSRNEYETFVKDGLYFLCKLGSKGFRLAFDNSFIRYFGMEEMIDLLADYLSQSRVEYIIDKILTNSTFSSSKKLQLITKVVRTYRIFFESYLHAPYDQIKKMIELAHQQNDICTALSTIQTNFKMSFKKDLQLTELIIAAFYQYPSGEPLPTEMLHKLLDHINAFSFIFPDFDRSKPPIALMHHLMNIFDLIKEHHPESLAGYETMQDFLSKMDLRHQSKEFLYEMLKRTVKSNSTSLTKEIFFYYNEPTEEEFQELREIAQSNRMINLLNKKQGIEVAEEALTSKACIIS